MDPIQNPLAPGAGTPPPELAGRDELRETVRIAIERVRRGLPARSVLMVGLRGVGKTVLLDRMRDEAEARRIQTFRIEVPENRSLPVMLVGAGLPQLPARMGNAKSYAERLFDFPQIGPLRSGGSTPGTRPRSRPSRRKTWSTPPPWRLPPWTRASSAFASTG